MRILAAADIHGALRVYEWIGQMAAEHRVNLLILAGDLFSCDPEDGQREQGRRIISVLKKTRVPCFYLMGNDDTVGLDYEDEYIKPLHGNRLPCRKHNIAGYQYSPPFVGTVFVRPESEIEKDLCSLEPLLDERTILVTHVPAYGTLDVSFTGEHVGSVSLAALLERRPVLAHIHGHIHESFGREGNHFNVAAVGQLRAILIDLPSLDHQVLVEG